MGTEEERCGTARVNSDFEDADYYRSGTIEGMVFLLTFSNAVGARATKIIKTGIDSNSHS